MGAAFVLVTECASLALCELLRAAVKSFHSHRLLLLSALLVLGAACREPTPPPSVSPADPAGPRPSQAAPKAPFELSAVVRRVHFAYRPEEGGWSAGHGTWSSRVTPEGLTFTPRHALEPSRVLRGTPVTFGAASLAREDLRLEAATGTGQVREDGSLVLARGEVEEQFLNGEAGVERRWHLARGPRGGGALRLRMPVNGPRLAGETARGVHYADATGLGVRLGDVTWTDASGQRTELRARAVAGGVEVLIPPVLLTSSSFPATLATTVSPEFGLDTPVTDPGAGLQSAPAIASNGSDYLVVWTDERVSTGIPDLYGTRVNQAGEVLDPLGILISSALNGQKDAAVAFDGTNYFVVWTDERNGGRTAVFGTRVSQAGAVLDPNGVKLSPTLSSAYMSRPAIAFDGTNFLVVWEHQADYFALPDLQGSLVSKAGVPQGSTLIVSNAANAQAFASLAFDGTNYLAVWEDNRSGKHTYAARISTTGSVLDPSGIRVDSGTHGEYTPRVVFDGTSFFAVWEDDRNAATTGRDVYGARISPAGTVLDPSGLALIQAAGNQVRPALVRTGTGLLLGWQEARKESTTDVYAARISGTGTVLDPTGFPVLEAPLAQGDVAMATNGAGFLVAWSDARNRDVVGTRLSATTTVLDPAGVTLSLAPNSETQPAVAFDGTNYLVAWQDNRGETLDIYGVRVSGSGAVLDPVAIPIAVAPRPQLSPAVAFDGTNYLVIWEDRRLTGVGDIFGTRVSKAGEVLDPSGLMLAVSGGAQESPAVAFDGTNYLVVWSGWEGTSTTDIKGVRVSPSGSVLDAAYIPICTNARYQRVPAVAFNGENYLVVWTDSPNDGTSDLYGARVSPGGAVLDAAGLLIDGGTGNTFSPALASDGTNVLVVWYETAAPTIKTTIRARRVGPTGTVLDAASIALTTLVDLQAYPAVVYDGKNFLVAWQDGRNTATSQQDLYGGHISRAGEVLDGNGFVISAKVGGELFVALAGGPPGVLAVYESADATLGANIQRVRGRMLTAKLNAPPTANAQSLTSKEDEALAVTLAGSDPDGDPLTYAVATPPSHGTLSGTGPALTYTPAPDYHGPDSFTFTVSDGQATSAPATVSLTITSENDAPVALNGSASTPEDTGTLLTLTGSDVDGDALSFTVVSGPSHGTLSGTAPALTYTPAPDYHGPDSFTFTVSDGQATSAPATVSLTVTSVEDVPVAAAQSRVTEEDTAVALTLSGTDGDGDSLSFSLVTSPAHGTLSGMGPDLTYTPAPDYHGPDSFTFAVSDGKATSAPATVSLTVSAVNDAPMATAQAVLTPEDTGTLLTLAGTDVDGDALSFTVVSGPRHGTLSGTAPALTYMPAPDYHGPDSFTFTVSDGQVTSAPATVSLTVSAVNDAPVATAQSVLTPEDTGTLLTLTGSDVDGDALGFTVVSGPRHGTLSGTAPVLTYTPAPGYHGSDSFTFTVSDGQATSAPATVSLTVTSVNDAPVADALSLTVPAGSPTPIFLTGSDSEDDPLTFAIITPPGVGKLSGIPPDVIYTPPPGFLGSTRFTFSVSDGENASSAEVLLTVVKRSLTVSASADLLRPAEGQSVRFYANAVDEAGAPISLRWDFGDGQTAQEQLPLHAFSAPGLFMVRLTASTPTEEATTALRLRVRTASPVVLAPGVSTERAVGEEGSTLSFRVEAPQPTITYAWTFGDGSSATGPSPSHAWADDGLFTVTVTASDASGPLWTASRPVLVHNAPPVPLPQDRLPAQVGLPLSVRLAASDAAGPADPLHWELVSGEGSLSADGTFQWTPERDGLATIITRVIDDEGGEARLAFQLLATQVPQVDPPPTPPGCGCGTTSGGAPGALGLGLLLLALRVRVRKARH